jgi:predicted transcriptional regulator|tara:strand:+ start:333 stop:548 length:216 start_codon:yes stop_codon:yes gene_type:complete
LSEADNPKGWAREWAIEVKKMRMQRGLTITTVATLANVSRDTLSRYESFQREPMLSKAMAISDVLGMGIEW